MEEFWTPEDFRDRYAAKVYADLTPIALRIIGRIRKPAGQVCGPITSGGVGNKAGNIAIFKQAIAVLKASGLSIFDQMPFEKKIWELSQAGQDEGTLLQTFYLPIFKSGMITTLYFIYRWETSRGASWEHEQALRLGIPIVYLKPDLTLP